MYALVGKATMPGKKKFKTTMPHCQKKKNQAQWKIDMSVAVLPINPLHQSVQLCKNAYFCHVRTRLNKYVRFYQIIISNSCLIKWPIKIIM